MMNKKSIYKTKQNTTTQTQTQKKQKQKKNTKYHDRIKKFMYPCPHLFDFVGVSHRIDGFTKHQRHECILCRIV